MFLELICFLCGAGLAILGCVPFGFWAIEEWYDFYRPIVLYMAGWIAGIAVLFLIEWIAGLFVNQKKPYDHVSKWARFWFMSGVRFITNHAHIWVEYRGVNKMPTHEKFLLVCNHRSKFDNFVITQKYGKLDIAFIMKKENGKIPVAKQLMPGMCYISVDREDKLQSLEAFKRAAWLIENNVSSVGVFPEGTRQDTDQLGEFHEGVFNIAIHTKAPIVVTAIKNTAKVHKRWPGAPTKVRYDVIAVIPYEEYQDMPAKALANHVRDMMQEHINRM